MLVYFTASIIGKKHYLNNYLKIVEILKTKKVEIVSDHIIKSDGYQVRMETRDDRLKFQEQLDKWITAADCIIAEVSFPSISVGYEISMAISKNKPVLLLYCEGNPPTLLAQHKDEKLICEKYSLDNLGEIISDFLKYVEGKEDSRFTFYITSEIAAFLEDVSKKEKLPKAVFIRKLIEKQIKSRKKPY